MNVPVAPRRRYPPVSKLVLGNISITELLRVAYLIAATTGYFLLRSFTVKAAVPMPDADGSLVVLVAVCGLFCLVCLGYITAVILAPMGFAYGASQLSNMLPPDQQGASRGSRLWIYCKRFGLTFAPYIFATMAFPVIINVDLNRYPETHLDQQAFNWHMNVVLALSGLVGFITLVICQCRYSSAGHTFLSRGNGLVGRFPLVGISFGSSFILWFVTNLIAWVSLFFALRTNFLAEDSSAWNLIWVYFVVVCWHCASITLVLWRQFYVAIAIGALIYIFPIFIFGGQLGGLVLRLTGMGGGIPISGYAKFVDSPSTVAITKRFDGCLVLRTGTKTVVQRPVYVSDKIKSCHLNPRTPIKGDSGKFIKTEIDTINNVDLIELRSDQFPQ